ncbi:MAG: hypothetical protein LBR58_01455 [Propionibacteriaceae bacterium]|jgi:hypothetical protein|nr:hypothetical protein [Propionibacteriaceae bacterium]
MIKRILCLATALAALVGATHAATYWDLVMITAVYSTLGPNATGWGPVTSHLPNTAMAISDAGSLMVWGLRAHGLPGNGQEVVPAKDPPTQIWLPNDKRSAADRRRVVKVAGVGIDNNTTDNQHAGVAALSDDGYVYTWGGRNTNHMMGRETTAINSQWWVPGRVAIAGKVVDLVSSAGVFMALTENGDLYTWGWAQGYGAAGQSGTDLDYSSYEPEKILDGVHSIHAGLWNGWAVRGNYSKSDNSTGVFWWGRADRGAAGDPSGDAKFATRGVPTRSKTLSKFATSGCDTPGVVAASNRDTCTIQQLTGHAYGSQLRLVDGSVYTWGDQAHFGTGRTGDATAPEQLDVLARNVQSARDYVFLEGVDGWAYLYGWYGTSTGPDPATGAAATAGIRRPTRFKALGRDWVAAGLHGNSGHVRRTDGKWVSWGGSVAAPPANNTYSVVPHAATTAPAPLTVWSTPGIA